MNSASSQNNPTVIRPVQYRDLETVDRLYKESVEAEELNAAIDQRRPIQIRRWFGLLKAFSWFPNPFRYLFDAHVADQNGQVQGFIQISPFNRTRSTWRVDRVVVSPTAHSLLPHPSAQNIGSQLLRHCFEKVWEARTWLLEVNVNDKAALALYRQNGFQPLAQMTYWQLAPELLQELAEREPDLPNLLPVSNADAQLLYQLDTVAMPPLVRQVFDRHTHDFKQSLFGSLVDIVRHWIDHTEVVSGYVFESQRKAAIGYFQIQLCRDGSRAHMAQLTVHPAYTWLYPELLAQMARIAQDFPSQFLQLASSDYQPEREEFLEGSGATRIAHTLMMSRSVWHKLREAKPVSLEGLQLADVFQGLQPARKPVPGRISLLKPLKRQPEQAEVVVPLQHATPDAPEKDASEPSGIERLASKVKFPEPHQEDPCC
jgi:ribosomal protein S18 acetylase RimI-like enzyme